MQFRAAVIHTRVPVELHQLLQREASARGMSASELVVRALKSALHVEDAPVVASFEPGDLAATAEVTSRQIARQLNRKPQRVRRAI